MHKDTSGKKENQKSTVKSKASGIGPAESGERTPGSASAKAPAKASAKAPVQKLSVSVTWQTCARVAFACFLLYLSVTWWRPLIRTAGRLMNAAVPLFLGFVIAYVVNILMSFYERNYFRRSTGRGWVRTTRRPVCLAAAIATVLGAVILILMLVLPQLGNALTVITRRIPRMLEQLSANEQIMGLLPESIQTAIQELDYNRLIAGVMNFLTNGASSMDGAVSVTSVVGSFSSRFMTGFMGFIFSIYILVSKEKLKDQFSRLAHAYLSTGWVKKSMPVLEVANDCFHNYIVGQVTEAVIIGVLCALGMWILRLPYAAMVGTVVGFTALIPVCGCYLGAAVGALMCLAASPGKAVLFLIFICILQQLEGNLIYPRVVGTSLGLPGIWVLAAVTAGGGIGGIAGMLFAVPVAATIYQLVAQDVHNRETQERRRMTAADVVDRLWEDEETETAGSEADETETNRSEADVSEMPRSGADERRPGIQS